MTVTTPKQKRLAEVAKITAENEAVKKKYFINLYAVVYLTGNTYHKMRLFMYYTINNLLINYY